MAITDKDGNEIIRISTFWEWSFKLLLASVPIFLGVLCTWGLWVTNMVINHDKEIYALLKSLKAIASNP